MQDQSVQSNYIDDEIQHNNNNSQFSNISDYKFQNYEQNQESYDQQDHDDDKNVYKQQLFENFKQTGVLNNLKATLRKQLIDKLQSSKQTGQEKDEMQTEKFQKNRFFYERRLLGYMIADFLRKHNFNYTYSVLLPEMQLESENVLQKEEIIEALRITPNEYQELIEIDIDKDLSAMEIVMEVIRKIKCTVKKEIHVQTEFEEDRNYKQKLEDVENQALKNMNKIQNTSIKNYEEQFLKYKSEMDRRYQEQLQDEISRLRELEIAELRAHENAEFQMKLKKYKYEMDKLYEEKLKKLKERERTALELCKRRQQEIDRMSFEQRAQHRKAIDDLKQRELELKKHNCLEGEEIKKEREKIKQMEASLKIKMREYDQAKMTINTRIQQDINDRKKIMQKENDLERTSQGGSLLFKNQDEQQRREYRENLQMLETQRQYLTRDLEIKKY
ncbi:hypothetical protein PPERSA_03204 [Pseudocohnilembus persalinus]|uniref:Uncharacterized protein n=1 Tax=Pseudocohnilembus persalinus TaxID=266149 RepID=A0A0V0QE53_PSEPJ|nr:hypothetical protein PPERSA_03204 [Pseudocohnilembus persalinus]|eukprot:KRX00471.1 hypothetical protein PPERSA_03204 [Pseudocohnilembus persalinus]